MKKLLVTLGLALSLGACKSQETVYVCVQPDTTLNTLVRDTSVTPEECQARFEGR